MYTTHTRQWIPSHISSCKLNPSANSLTISNNKLFSPFNTLLGNETGAWVPIPPLQVANADTTLVLLASNSILYLTPVTDPWFSATTTSSPGGAFAADSFISGLACVDQYQICNPGSNDNSCTAFGDSDELSSSFVTIGLNPAQVATAARLSGYLNKTDIFTTISSLLSTSALLAQDLLSAQALASDKILAPQLPSNQWQTEVKGWFEAGLAKLQASVVAYPAQPMDLAFTETTHPNSASTDPSDLAAVAACSNQRVRNTGAYQSFSGVGLIIIIVLGLIIIIVSWTAESCVVALRRRRRVKYRKLRNAGANARADDISDHREIARIADRKLQLQRVALLSSRPDVLWERTMDSVPCPRDERMLFPRPVRVEAEEECSDDDFRYQTNQRDKAGRVEDEKLESVVVTEERMKRDIMSSGSQPLLTVLEEPEGRLVSHDSNAR
jgi:hypothetical protein